MTHTYNKSLPAHPRPGGFLLTRAGSRPAKAGTFSHIYPTARRGFTLVELMIATAVGAILSAAALQLFSNQIGFTRSSALVAELQDRARTARELITQDIMQTGYYWSHGGRLASNKTGAFGAAGLGINMTDWPSYPVSGGQNHFAGTDQLYLIQPTGKAVAGNADPTSSNFKCRETAPAMGLTAPTGADLSSLGANTAALLTGGDFTALTKLTAVATGSEGITADALLAAHCTAASEAISAGDTLPDEILILPVKGVTYAIKNAGSATNVPSLVRCETTTPAQGPLYNSVVGQLCSSVVMRGIEDLQFKYLYAHVGIDSNGNVVASDTGLVSTQNSYTLNHPGFPVTYKTGFTAPLRMIAEKGAAVGSSGALGMRFVGIEVGLVARSIKPDQKYNGHRPTLLGHAAGPADHYRRVVLTWRVMVPNAWAF